METETETKTGYSGVETTLAELASQQEAMRKEAQALSVWKSIDDGKTARLSFTGRVFKREAQFEGGTSLKLGFELSEKTPDGVNKIFEVGNKSSLAREIIQRLRAAKQYPVELLIKRKGVGRDTRYEVIDLEG